MYKAEDAVWKRVEDEAGRLLTAGLFGEKRERFEKAQEKTIERIERLAWL